MYVLFYTKIDRCEGDWIATTITNLRLDKLLSKVPKGRNPYTLP